MERLGVSLKQLAKCETLPEGRASDVYETLEA